MSYKAVNPYTGELIKEFDYATDEEVDQALDRAESFYKAAKTQPISERAANLHRLAKEFTDHTDKYAKYATTNMGKLFKESQGEIQKNFAFADYYAKHGEEFLKNIPSNNVPNADAHVELSSTGTFVAFEPWNFPTTQVIRVFGPNYTLGYPVILKLPSLLPEFPLAFSEACKNAGLEDGAFQNIFVNYDQVNHMLSDIRVQGLALTGSEKAGKRLAAEAGTNLTKSTMELGGTDVFMVLDDADVKKAADDAVAARFSNAGQVCTSAKRYLVSDKVYDDFAEELFKQVAKLKPGDPMNPETTLAPLSSVWAKKILHDQVAKVIAGGADVLYGDPEMISGNNGLFLSLIHL